MYEFFDNLNVLVSENNLNVGKDYTNKLLKLVIDIFIYVVINNFPPK